MQALPVLARPPLLTAKARTNGDSVEDDEGDRSRRAWRTAAPPPGEVPPHVLLPKELKPLVRNFLIAESILNYGHPQASLARRTAYRNSALRRLMRLHRLLSRR